MGAATTTTNYSDLWSAANEHGWGLNISQQADTLFATLFIYGSGEQAVWYSVTLMNQSTGPDGAGTYSGTLYETTGPANGTPYNPALLKYREVGLLTIAFGDDAHGLLTYTVDGAGTTKAIARLTFTAQNVVGSYIGSTQDVTFGCTNPMRNGLVTTDSGPLTITQTGNAMTIQVADVHVHRNVGAAGPDRPCGRLVHLHQRRGRRHHVQRAASHAGRHDRQLHRRQYVLQVQRQYRRHARPAVNDAGALLRRLRTVRGAYGAAAEREKRELLVLLRATRLMTAAHVAALHQDLLFLCAFPDSSGMQRLARRLLLEIRSRVARLPRAQRTVLDDTGIAGSTTRYVLPYPIASWLARSGADAEIDWQDFGDDARLDAFVGALLQPAEREAFDSGEFTTRAFLAMAKPNSGGSTLRWLLDAAAATPSQAARLADDWNQADIPVAWRLADSRASVTHNVLSRVPVVQRTAVRRPPADATGEFDRPLASIERLPRAAARRVIDSARAALTARCREVDAMTYPNPDEIWWCDLGEGVALAVIGVAPAHRLALETNTGYLLFANGVPIGYGGVTPLFRQANTGINVFDPFRGSEAAFLWTQMLRAFHTLYGSRRFVINAYQFGAGNAEAIRSGAFWFYYRLGFRPANAGTRGLAEREAKRMTAHRKYRCDARTLRALADGDLHLDLPGYDPADFFDEPLLPRAGVLAARVLANETSRSRTEAARRIARRLADALGIDDYARWSASERRGLEMLAPIVAGLPGLLAWDPAERAALAAMLRAKGGTQERHFALKAHRATRFFHELRSALRQAPRSPERNLR